MREWAVSGVMEQNGSKNCFLLLRTDSNIFRAEGLNCLCRQVHCPDAVLETGMHRPGIYITRESQLPDIAKSLEPGMAHKIKNEISRHGDKTVYGVIDDLSLVGQ